MTASEEMEQNFIKTALDKESACCKRIRLFYLNYKKTLNFNM